MESNNIVFVAKKQAELIQEELPPLPDDAIIVRSTLSLISSGTESICFRAEMDEGTHWADWVKYPFYPGYSNVGTVEQVGKNVSDCSVGDRVFSMGNHRQLHIVQPPLKVIPDNISDESAAWSKLGTIAQTGVRRARLEMGDSVVIIGLGPIGQLLTQYSRLMGVDEIIAIDPVANRLEIAKAHGATQAFAGSAADAGQFVADHTGGRLADVVFDATGHYAVFPLALKLVRQFGTMILVGDSPYPSRQKLTADIVTRQITVRGSHNEYLPDERLWPMHRQIDLLYRYIERGQVKVDDLITSRRSPHDAQQVYSDMLTNRAENIGVAFDWREM